MNRFASIAMPPILGLSPYQPGKPESELERELGISNIVKLASNENPWGPSPLVVEALKKGLSRLSRYPDGGGYALKSRIAEKLSLSPDRITLGNGSSEILEIIARLFLGPDRAGLFSEYSFAMYPLIVQALGAEARIAKAFPADATMPYGHDLDAMARLVEYNTRLVLIANPNNPTGTYLSESSLYRFIEALPAQVICVVDEAYFEYACEDDYPNTLSWVEKFPNLIVTRTFSKAYGVAGLRVGYAISNPEIAELMNRIRQPFNVNSMALEGALAALGDQDHLQKSVEFNRSGLKLLAHALSARNYPVIPSIANFIAIDAKRNSMRVFNDLLREGVIVRPLAAYRMANHIRVTVGTPDENARFLEAFDTVMARV